MSIAADATPEPQPKAAGFIETTTSGGSGINVTIPAAIAFPPGVAPSSGTVLPSLQDMFKAAASEVVPQMIADALDHHTNNVLLPTVEKLIADAATPAGEKNLGTELVHLNEWLPASERTYVHDIVLALGVALILVVVGFYVGGNTYVVKNFTELAGLGVFLLGLQAKL